MARELHLGIGMAMGALGRVRFGRLMARSALWTSTAGGCLSLASGACGGLDLPSMGVLPAEVDAQAPLAADPSQELDAGTSRGADAEPARAPSQRASGCILDVTPGFRSIPCEGFTFDVEVPTACATTRCGLVVDVHGFSMSGRMEDKSSRARELGRRHGFIVVQPNANPAPPLSGWDFEGSNDAKIKSFMEQAIQAWDVDRRRVHMMGFSQGGAMTWRFVCRYPGLLASAAPAAAPGGGPSEVGKGACPNLDGGALPKDVDVLLMGGANDSMVSFAEMAKLKDDWVARQRMSPTAPSGDAGAGVSHLRYKNPEGLEFEFIRHEYTTAKPCLIPLGGHCFPGSPDTETTEPGQICAFACGGTNAFHWGEEAFAFFLAHPR